MNHAKWVAFCLCFLSVMAAAGVWWVEQKITQVTNVVDGAVDRVQETVNAPMEAAFGLAGEMDEALAEAPNAIGKAFLDFDQAITDFGNQHISPGSYKSLREIFFE